MSLLIATSTSIDGSMKPATGHTTAQVNRARKDFLSRHGIKPSDTTLVDLTYDRNDYCEYITVNDDAKGSGLTRPSEIIADGIVVTQPGHALFLPLADCIGAVIHDPIQGILMVSHLGRHNLEQHGGIKSIEYLIDHHNSNPATIAVWLSPAAGKVNYPLFAFERRSLHEVAIEQLVAAGVPPGSITVSPIDSSEDSHYFSHSQFLKGRRPTDGRFAIVATIKA